MTGYSVSVKTRRAAFHLASPPAPSPYGVYLDRPHFIAETEGLEGIQKIGAPSENMET